MLCRSPAWFRASIKATRPGGEVIWLGQIDVAHGVTVAAFQRALTEEGFPLKAIFALIG